MVNAKKIKETEDKQEKKNIESPKRPETRLVYTEKIKDNKDEE